MIKQNWIISEEDRRTILSLHERATKNNYLIFEQDTPNNENKVTENIIINFNFPTGFHSNRTPGIIDQVTEAFRKLKQFLDKYNNPKVSNVVIESGESAVPNRDNENIQPDGLGLTLRRGELANRRSVTIQNLLTQNFDGLVETGYLPNVPEFTTNISGGTATERNSPKALEEQFVRAIFTVQGEEKPNILECDFNLQFKIEYKSVGTKNSRYHCCNNAEFTLLLNNIPIKVQGTDTTVFNLNNRKDCGARSQILNFDSTTAKEILSIREPIDVKFKCQSVGGQEVNGKKEKLGCHEAPMLVTVFKDGKPVGESKYLGTLKDKSIRMAYGEERVVAKIDKCGNFISIDSNAISDTGESVK